MKSPILGGAYTASSINVADNRCINLFSEPVLEGSESPAYLQRCPGLRLLANIGNGPIRGMWAFQSNTNKSFVLSGNSLYRIDKSWNATLVGTVTGVGPVSIADNGRQLFIASDVDSYIYDDVNQVLSRITDVDFSGAVTVGFLDGFFVFNQPNSQRLWVTALNDGTSIDALDFSSAEGAPDNIVGIVVDHREVWVFGENSVEVWYNAGNADFPLSRIQGAFNEIGCAAKYSISRLDNGLFWLAKDARGKGMVYRANGYTGQRISTHSIETEIQKYSDISDAIGYTYQQNGHSFYVLTFPTANKTWCFDVATGLWHERASWSDGNFTRHRGACQMSFNNEIVIGDYQNGKIYAFDLTRHRDDTGIQKYLRSWKALSSGQNDYRRTAHHSLQLHCETGSIQTNVEPQIMLRWSDDSGHTWSNEHWANMGKIGEYFNRVIWRRLGMTLKLRDRIYEISGTDENSIYITGAEIKISATSS